MLCRWNWLPKSPCEAEGKLPLAHAPRPREPDPPARERSFRPIAPEEKQHLPPVEAWIDSEPQVPQEEMKADETAKTQLGALLMGGDVGKKAPLE